MSKNTLLSELINYISANASGNVVIAAPSSGYALDVTGTGRFTGQLTLGSTITNGTYTYTLPGATGTLALTSQLSSYLPLSGGTLTGALSGTSATFSSSVLVKKNGSDSANDALALVNAAGDRYFNWQLDSSGNLAGWRYSGSSFNQWLSVNYSNGNVGIGTTSPGYPLHVVIGSTSSDANNTNTGSTANLYNYFVRQKGASNGISGIQYMLQTFSDAGANGMEIYTQGASSTLVFGTAATERMRITSGGNVGVNTTSPQDKLDVNGSIRFRANTPNFTAVADSGVFDYVPTSIFSTDPCIRIAAIGSSTVPASIRFQVGSTTTGPIERLRLTPSGVLGLNGDSLEASGGFDKFSLGFSVGNYAWIQSWGGNVIYLNKQGNAVYAGTQRIDNNSDARIKSNIQNIENALETVLSLSGKKFNMLDENNILRYGFIAQEVEPHLSDFVTHSDRKFEKGDVKIENLLTLESSGSAWGALLVEAIKEQQAQIEELKQLINN
jgi:hypothetical protein